MKKTINTLVLIATLFVPLFGLSQQSEPNPDAQQILSKTKSNFFIENKGQWPAEVRYLARIGGMNAWITNGGVVYDYYKITRDYKPEETMMLPPHEKDQFEREHTGINGQVVEMLLEGANKEATSQPSGMQEGYYNYFIGNDPTKWASFVRLYNEVLIQDIYPGIDIRYYFDNGLIRYDYIAKPGADLAQINLKIIGSDGYKINETGELTLKTCIGKITHGKLYAYQQLGNQKTEVSCSFVKNKRGQIGVFAENYDPSLALVIDPLVYSTYIGGAAEDCVKSIKVDSSGNAYLTGFSLSGNFPTKTGSYDLSQNGNYDLIVTKINSNGTNLEFSTFIGGINDDVGNSISIDKFGNSYITGYTNSGNYPITSGAYDSTYSHWSDVIVTKLNPSGSTIVYSTFISGIHTYGEEYGEFGNSIAIDDTGNVFITGYTWSSHYPTTTGAYDVSWGPGHDAFISKLNSTGTALVYSTFIGGSKEEIGNSITIDDTGNAYIAGWTNSIDFPTTIGAFDTSSNGGNDVFVVKLNSSGTSLTYSTYLGGGANDEGNSLEVDDSGYTYVTGYTYSMNYPSTKGAFDENYSNDKDVYISILNPSGSVLSYSTFFGGTGSELAFSLAIDSNCNIYITGNIYSADFPITNGAYNSNYKGYYDLFMSKLNKSVSSLIYSTFITGSVFDYSNGIAIDEYNNTYIVGTAMSNDYQTTTGSYDPSYNGGSHDGFVTKILPINQALNLNFSNFTSSSLQCNWSKGGGEKRAVFIKQTAQGIAFPVNGTTYTANDSFGLGSQIGTTGWYCVYNDTGSAFTINKLSPNSTYRVMVCEYNGSAGKQFYNTDSMSTNPKSCATLYETPSVQSSNLNFSGISGTNFSVSCTKGNGTRRAFFIKAGTYGTAVPVNNITYTANAAFGYGSQIGSSDWYCIYNDTGRTVDVSNLSSNTYYRVMICEYKGVADSQQFNIDSVTTNPVNQVSDYAIPTTQATNLVLSGTSTTSLSANWTNGDGTARVVFITSGNSGSVTLNKYSTYTAIDTFGKGSQEGGWYCVYNGTGSSCNINGLTINTVYRIMVCEYHGTAGRESFNTNTSTNNPMNYDAIPATQANSIMFSNYAANSFTASWTNGNGATRAVFVAVGNSGTATPSNNTTYNPSGNFGSGSQIGNTGWYCVYNGTGSSVGISGLMPNTTYRLMVCEYNGASSREQYNIYTDTINPRNYYPIPTTQAYDINFSSVAATSMNLSWASGNGAKRTVFITQSNSGTVNPDNYNTYTANTVFGSGSQVGSSGWYCIYDGTGTSVSVNGLTGNTTYRLMVCEYNGVTGEEVYNVGNATNNPSNQTTDYAVPTTQATAISYTNVTSTGFDVSWARGNGSSIALFITQGNSGYVLPVVNTSYNASGTFGSGSQVGSSGWYCIYNATDTFVSVTGLNPNTIYRIMACEFNGTIGKEKYNTNNAANNPLNQTTDYAVPTGQAYNISFSNITDSSFTSSWTNGNGSNRAVFIKAASSGIASPITNTTYNAHTRFGNGTQIGTSGWYCIYNGSGTQVSVTGLSPTTTYRLMVCEYNGTSGWEKYNTNSATVNPNNQITDYAVPSTQASNISFNTITSTSFDGTWTNGNGTARVVFIKAATSGTPMPVNNNSYSANSGYGSGSQIGASGWYCVYDGTGNSVSISNLTPNTTYRLMVCEYNGIPGSEKYSRATVTNNPANQTTDFAIPTTQSSSISFSTISDSSFFASWTSGNGTSRAVFLKAGTTGIAAPVINTAYTSDAKFRSGSQISTSGWYCVYNGSGASVTVTGLTANTTYRMMVCDYNGIAGFEKYNTNTGSNNPANQTTDYLAPDIQASGIIASSVISTNFNIDWKKGNGSKCAVFIKSATTGTATPDNNTNYIPNPYFGTGSQIRSTGWYCIYNGFDTFASVSGLTQNTTYRIMICEYNGTIGSEKYNINSSTNNPLNVLTDFSPPTVQAYSIQVTENYSNSIKINWTKGNGTKAVGFVKATVSGNAMPVNNAGYVADSVYKSGSQIGTSGWYCFYNGTGHEAAIYGLSANKNYRIMICEYNGTSGKEKYKTDASSDNPLNNLTMPSLFNISGGGEYCVDKSPTGININLDSSETGVSYQLIRNTVPDGNPINGNNKTIVWKNLIFGTYTVEASNNSGTNTMNGTITIIENPLPTPQIQGLASEYCFESAVDTIAGIPSGGAFSGSGINVTFFNPATAGTGKHIILYNYTDAKGCKNVDSAETTVQKLTVNLNYTSVTCGEEAALHALATYTGTGNLTYSWNPKTGLDDTTSANPLASIIDDVTVYNVQVSSVLGCKANDTGTVYLMPMDPIEICLVTVDTSLWKNKILWERPTPQGAIRSFNIYKEISTNVYDSIGNVPYNQSSQFVDLNSNPESNGERYKITMLDSCGKESGRSFYHQTMNLTISAAGSVMGLRWDPYKDESGTFTPSNYYIYRGTAPDNLQLHKTVSGSMVSVNDDNVFSVYYYLVGLTKSDGCDLNRSGDPIMSFSNKKDNKSLIGIKEQGNNNSVLIYPNPFTQSTTISFPNDSKQPYNLRIFDLSGKVVREIQNIRENQVVVMKGDLSVGLYYFELVGGEIYKGRFVVE